MKIKQILNADEAAALVGRSKRNIYDHLYKGDIEASKSGPYWRIDRTSLLRCYNLPDPELPEPERPQVGSGYPAYLGGNLAAQQTAGHNSAAVDKLIGELSQERDTYRALMESNATLRVELAETRAREQAADERAKAATKACDEMRRELNRLKEALYGTLRTRRDREVVIG